MAAGEGTRLYPLTRCASKQLMPVFDKPMIYYPLSTLMLAGIRDILVVTTPGEEAAFRTLLGDGSDLGISLAYASQPEPRGIAGAYRVGADFLGDAPSALILGDNIFYGQGFPAMLRAAAEKTEGATVFAYYVDDASAYGVISFDGDWRFSAIRRPLPSRCTSAARMSATAPGSSRGWRTSSTAARLRTTANTNASWRARCAASPGPSTACRSTMGHADWKSRWPRSRWRARSSFPRSLSPPRRTRPHAVAWRGGTPVFADVRPDTHTLDPASVEALVTERTTGILGAHVWGQPCDIDGLEAVARRHGLKLLFDAAHALGCSHRGRRIGAFGDAAVFSFHATKFVNSFQGGAIVTDDDAMAERARLMINFGMADSDRVELIGTNGKMSEPAAAMG